MTGCETPSSACTIRPDEIGVDGFSSSNLAGTNSGEAAAAACTGGMRLGDGFGSGPMGPGPTDEHSVHPHHRDFIVTPITDQIGPIDSVSKTEKSHSPKSSSHAQHIELSITDSACKNQLVVVSVQYGPFNPYIPIRSTTIGKSRVAIDPIAMRTSWRSNSDITSATSIGYPRMSARGESSTTMHRLLHASGSHPIPPPDDPKYKRDDRRADDRYRKEERYRRDEEDNERTVDRSKDKSKYKFKERSNDRRMKTSSNKKPSRRHDRKVLVAEESTKSWADSDSESSSSSSSSSDSEQEEVHCLMANQTDDDEVFDFSNVEFTRDDLVTALNDMVKECRKLSHSFEEAKAENMSLKSSSIESNSDEFEDIDILKTELSKLQAENEMLKDETISDKTGVGFNSSEFSEGETSTQSRSAYDKFNKMSFVKADMIYNCLESVKYDNQNSPKLSDNGKAGIGFSKPESFKPNWLKNRLDKDKAKAGQKPFVPNQSWHNSKKGESSSRGPQQPSDVQIRDSAVSGSAGRTPTFAQSVEIAQRRIVETVLDADRNVENLERQVAAEDRVLE
ncbi:hypothetical protein F511_36875 [Dorcoceras hygrometricum]|uniref:Uncharacterized protein n=1 Tax=Dorcoceras hygrometricum TaxID=472368 RepID=A0A2Z7CF47_9LAMI|nr:hypothetical protein F511_36875 [Dorcoceras hygrometricum]